MRKLSKFFINLIPSRKIRNRKIFYHNIHGQGNQIEGKFPKRISGQIWGNNNKIIFGDNLDNFQAELYIGSKDSPADNCLITIGKDTTAGHVSVRLMEDNSSVSIGEDCMFSDNISILASDTHSIFDINAKLLNLGKSVKIGNHVWVGADVKIGKNTKIPDNSIVGWGSVVTKKFDKAGIVIAGNPAAEVKEGINWSRLRPKQFLAKQK